MFPDIRGFHETANSSSAAEGGTLPREGQTAAAPAPAPAMVTGSGSVISGSSVEESSPKQQKKKSSFFSSNKDKGDKSGSGKEKSIFKKLRPSVKSSSAAAAENVENGSGEESSGGHSNNAGTSSSSRYQFMKSLITVTDFGCSTLCLVLPGLIRSYGKLVELAEQLGKTVEHHYHRSKSTQLNSTIRADAPPCTFGS